MHNTGRSLIPSNKILAIDTVHPSTSIRSEGLRLDDFDTGTEEEEEGREEMHQEPTWKLVTRCSPLFFVLHRVIVDAEVDHRKSTHHTNCGQRPCREENVYVSVIFQTGPNAPNGACRRLTVSRRRRHAMHRPNQRIGDTCLSDLGRDPFVQLTKIASYSQNPVNTASLARLLDMAPMSQYAYVCHMESRKP